MFADKLFNLQFTIMIPVDQKFACTKVTAPLNSLENSKNHVMTLEDSHRLIDII